MIKIYYKLYICFKRYDVFQILVVAFLHLNTGNDARPLNLFPKRSPYVLFLCCMNFALCRIICLEFHPFMLYVGCIICCIVLFIFIFYFPLFWNDLNLRFTCCISVLHKWFVRYLCCIIACCTYCTWVLYKRVFFKGSKSVDHW